MHKTKLAERNRVLSVGKKLIEMPVREKRTTAPHHTKLSARKVNVYWLTTVRMDLPRQC